MEQHHSGSLPGVSVSSAIFDIANRLTGRLAMSASGECARYQYVSAGRISIAPPRRALGMRAANSIAALTSSPSKTM
jgi:hypothetical protein